MRKIISLIILMSILITTPALAGHWFGGQYKDSFGDTTAKGYIKYDIAKCKVIISEDSKVGIFPRGYNLNGGIVKMKNSDGEILRMKAYKCKRGIKLGGYESEALISFLQESTGTVRVLIQDRDSTKYRFKINTISFNESWDWLQNQ